MSTERKQGHSALRVNKGNIEKFDLHPSEVLCSGCGATVTPFKMFNGEQVLRDVSGSPFCNSGERVGLCHTDKMTIQEETIDTLSAAHFDAFYGFCQDNEEAGRDETPLLDHQKEVLSKIERAIKHVSAGHHVSLPPVAIAPEPQHTPLEKEMLAALKASLVEHEALHEVLRLNPQMRGIKPPAIIATIRAAISRAEGGKQ